VKIALVAFSLLLSLMILPRELHAQDIPGIEICTVEKTMERRTSCLQSNVDFLQKTITKLAADHQQKLDAANRQIDGLKAAVMSLQRTVGELQAQKNDVKKDTAPATAKDGANKDDAKKDGAK
jgi:prefoldin subunit 5